MQAVIYARFSPRPNAAECESIETQLARCRAYCQAKGWTVSGEYADANLSGGSLAERVGLEAALESVCRRGRVLVVYSLSRLARNTRDALDLAAKIDAAGADLAVLDMSIDTSSALGRFTFTLMAALAQLEREQTAERTSDAMLRRQASGQRMSSEAPYGWKVDPTDPARLVEDIDEQDVIAIILQWKAEGDSARTVAANLNATKTPCRGSKWHHETVKRIVARATAKA